jgi:hypothetical protein
MFIAAIHWRIKPDQTEEFLAHWKGGNRVKNRDGLIAEFLSDAIPPKNFPDTTWHLDPESLGNFRSYVTVGLWRSEQDFLAEIGGYFDDTRKMQPFEKYRRRRVVFDPVGWRIGNFPMPTEDSAGVA